MSGTCSLFPPFGDPWPSCLLPSHNYMSVDNLKEMHKFLEMYCLQSLNQSKKTENMNKTSINNKTESII